MALPRTRHGKPRLRCTGDVFSYWAERIEQRDPLDEWFSYSSMIVRRDSIYHYGTHFELARILRTRAGDARLVLLNGDSYSGAGGFGPSTGQRQAQARGEVQRSRVPGLVAPFSALESAGIDFKTVQPIHVRDDRETRSQHESARRPTDKLSTMDDPSGATKTERRWDYQTHEQRDVEVPVRVPHPNQTLGFSRGHAWSEGATRGEDGLWHWTEHRHWLGDCVFRAKLTETRTRRATAEELAGERALRDWEAERSRLRALAERLPHLPFHERGDGRRDGRYDFGRMFRLQMAAARVREMRADHDEHQPPNSFVRNGRVAHSVTRWATFLSSFDYQESRPLYFLAELPHRARPATVEDAIASLKPPEVLAAEARGVTVVRQGDLFAIPTKLDRRRLRRMSRTDFEKRFRVLDTNHSVTEGVLCRGGATLGRGTMRHEPEGWRPPDHARQKLGDGKTWHLLVRNTVPRTR